MQRLEKSKVNLFNKLCQSPDGLYNLTYKNVKNLKNEYKSGYIKQTIQRNTQV